MKNFLKKWKKGLITTGVIGVASATIILSPTEPISQPIGAISCIEDSTKGVNERIINCPITDVKEKANLKGIEIAKIGSISRVLHGKYEIEITGLNPIEGGVEFYVRAWDLDGTPIGLGVSKRFEKEHFRIFNPPILVDDSNGTIVREWTTHAENGIFQPSTTKQRKLREDLREALLQVVEHNIKVTGRKGSAVLGSVGNTTSTFYPVADSASPIDSYVNNADSVWATIHDAATGMNTGDSNPGIEIISDNGRGGSTVEIWRTIIHWDTAAIGDADTIDSATGSLWVVTKEDGYNDAQGYIALVGLSSPASDTGIVAADYDQVGSTKMGANTDITDITTGQYTNMTINATGLTNISKTGLTRWGAREGHDIENVMPADNGQRSRASVSAADTDGTTQDPKLVVVHSGAEVAPTGRNRIQIFYESLLARKFI